MSGRFVVQIKLSKLRVYPDVLKQIITGERSSKQLGSFITIAEYSGLAIQYMFNGKRNKDM